MFLKFLAKILKNIWLKIFIDFSLINIKKYL